MTELPKAVAEFELTPEDWEEVNAVHLFDSDLNRQLLKKTRVVSFLLFMTLALLSLLLGFATGAILFGATGLVFPSMVKPMHERGQRQALQKLTAQGIANGTFGPHRVEVREEGLFHSTHAYESLFRWHAIEKVKEKSGHFMVYMGPNAFLPIPATAFPDSKSLRGFADAFYERLGKHRELAPGADASGIHSPVATTDPFDSSKGE